MFIPVRPVHETSTHNFSCSGGTDTDSTKYALGHVTLNVYYCIRWDLWVTYIILLRPGRETSMHYFLCLGGPSVVSRKSVGGHVT
jgi:hypothetical protein